MGRLSGTWPPPSFGLCPCKQFPRIRPKSVSWANNFQIRQSMFKMGFCTNLKLRGLSSLSSSHQWGGSCTLGMGGPQVCPHPQSPSSVNRCDLTNSHSSSFYFFEQTYIVLLCLINVYIHLILNPLKAQLPFLPDSRWDSTDRVNNACIWPPDNGRVGKARPVQRPNVTNGETEV